MNADQKFRWPAGQQAAVSLTYDDALPVHYETVELNGWIILMFHGVGEGTHSLFIDDGPHAELLAYLEAQSERIWTASMVKVAKHLRNAGYAETGGI